MNRNPKQLTEQVFDLLIIGGGINGAGAARDGARRGLKVALIDKSDFAAGTSSASSHLVHGGIRYLEQMAFGLVHESLRERKTLLEIAPHIVHPLRFHIPVYRGQKKGRLILKCGLTLYDLLAWGRNIGTHRLVNNKTITDIHPDFHTTDLTGGLEYGDAWMDDARLCLANVIDAQHSGAVVANYVEANDIQTQEKGGFLVRVTDQIANQSHAVRCRTLLNATGPWSDRFIHRTLHREVKRLHTSKGVHLIFDRPMPQGNAVLLFASDDRIFFVIPFYGKTMVGTTDTPFEGNPDELSVTEDDITYLIESISKTIATPDQWRRSLVGSFAGVRPLVAQAGRGTYRTSREHLLVEDQPGMFTLVGGKFTTYRAMAEQTVDRICKYLKHSAKCTTATPPLPGGDIDDFAGWAVDTGRRLEKHISDPQMRRYLMQTLGANVESFVEHYAGQPDNFQRIYSNAPVPRAMLDYAKQNEMAITDDDLYRRRTPLELLGWRA